MLGDRVGWKKSGVGAMNHNERDKLTPAQLKSNEDWLNNMTYEIEERPLTPSDLESILGDFVSKLGGGTNSAMRIETNLGADQPSLYSLIENIVKGVGRVPKEILDQLLTYADVAERWKVSGRHVKKIKAQGKLRPAPLGGRMVRFSEEELLRYISEEEPKRTKRRQK